MTMQKQLFKRHFGDGFTLTELMITVALASLLAGLALPTLTIKPKKQSLLMPKQRLAQRSSVQLEARRK